VLRRVHGVRKLVRVPADGLRGLDLLAIESLDLDNLRCVSFFEQPPDGERMALGTGEAKRVGQFLLERIPEFRFLVVFEGNDCVVVTLEFLVLFGGCGNRPP
jgi:hypothetical protein